MIPGAIPPGIPAAAAIPVPAGPAGPGAPAVVMHVRPTPDTPPPDTRFFRMLNSVVQLLQNSTGSMVAWGGRAGASYGTYAFVMASGEEFYRHAGIEMNGVERAALNAIALQLAAFAQCQYVGTAAAMVECCWNTFKEIGNCLTRPAFGVNVFGGPPDNPSFLAKQARIVPVGFGLSNAGKVAAVEIDTGTRLPPTWEGVFGADPSGNALLTLLYAFVWQGAPFIDRNLHFPKVSKTGLVENLWNRKNAAMKADTKVAQNFYPVGVTQGMLNLTLLYLAHLPEMNVVRAGLGGAVTAEIQTTRVRAYTAARKANEATGAVAQHAESPAIRAFQIFSNSLMILGCLTAVGMVAMDPSQVDSTVSDDVWMNELMAGLIVIAGEALHKGASFALNSFADPLAPDNSKAADELNDMFGAAEAVAATYAAGPLAGFTAAAMTPLFAMLWNKLEQMLSPPAAAVAAAVPPVVPVVPAVPVAPGPVVPAVAVVPAAAALPLAAGPVPVPGVIPAGPNTATTTATAAAAVVPPLAVNVPVQGPDIRINIAPEGKYDTPAASPTASEEAHLRAMTSRSALSPSWNPMSTTRGADLDRMSFTDFRPDRELPETPTATPTPKSRFRRLPDTPSAVTPSAIRMEALSPFRRPNMTSLAVDTPTSSNRLLPDAEPVLPPTVRDREGDKKKE